MAIRDDELTVSAIALRSEIVIGIPDRSTGGPILEAHPGKADVQPRQFVAVAAEQPT